MEKVDNLHTVSLLYKLLSSCNGTSELMYGFELSQAKRRLELTNHKTEKDYFMLELN